MDRILRTRLPVALSLGLDILLVIVFVLIGRRSHEHAFAMPDLILALIPWLVGLVAGWGLIRWRSGAWPDRVTHAVTLAIVTVAVTMILRPLMGQSVGDGFTGLLSFVGVALAFLLLFLLGWRIIVAFIARSSPR
ncbi:MAG TPA: DUF3054 domain-containing protein [Intrasporangiaceae bacterium]|nr:DUF3054 domain-containing protein [Intrasporangiaceae bacterium]